MCLCDVFVLTKKRLSYVICMGLGLGLGCCKSAINEAE
jgi:hypothetical protein